MAKSGIDVVVDNSAKVLDGIKRLTSTQVLVGVPAETAGRGTPINNAALAYIHDNGAPEVGIPARPFMKPGIQEVKGEVEIGFKHAGELALAGQNEAVSRQFERIGSIARDAIKRKINEGIPPPLKEGTLKARARRGRKGAALELKRRAKGEAPSVADAKPLIDTGQLRNSISYVVRKKS